jgi:hypothetical protein
VKAWDQAHKEDEELHEREQEEQQKQETTAASDVSRRHLKNWQCILDGVIKRMIPIERWKLCLAGLHYTTYIIEGCLLHNNGCLCLPNP